MILLQKMAQILESHSEIKDFLNASTPTHSQIVKAYTLRDNILGQNTNDVFFHTMKKLGLHPDFYQSQIDNRYRNEMITRINTFLEDKSTPMVSIDYHAFTLNLMNTDYKQRLIRYNELFKMKDNIEDVYSALSTDELGYIGW